MEIDANKVIEILTEQLKQANLDLVIKTVQVEQLQEQLKKGE